MSWVFWVILVLLFGGFLVWLFSRATRLGRILKWTFWVALIVVVGGFLHYTLPQRDIVRIVTVNTRITTVGENSIFYASPDLGTGESVTQRDIRFIDAIRPNGRPIVYRNEDTGWVWPPYFKYDSSNLQAEASDMLSTAQAPKWVAVTHYGWRIAWLSIYPNAIKIRPVDGPDVTLIPWVNIIVLTGLALLLFLLRRMVLRFFERTVDPLRADVQEAMDRAEARADGARAGLRGWLDSWRSKPRP